MLFTKLTPLLPCFVAALSASAPPSAAPVSLRPLFSASIELGKPISASPIPIPGGVRELEPITGGNITGAVNATVQAGLAYPALYQNSTLEVPAIILYGTTHDKVPYLIQISGTGKLTGQETRVQIEIGGKYSALADAFLIAQLMPNAARTMVIVDGYEVEPW